MTEISMEEWLKAISEASDGPCSEQRGMTRRELAKEWGISGEATMKRLMKASELGWLQTGKKRVSTLSGGTTLVPAYWFKKPDAVQPKSPAKARRT